MRISCEVSIYTLRLEKTTKDCWLEKTTKDCRLADSFTSNISFFDSADTKTATKIPFDKSTL